MPRATSSAQSSRPGATPASTCPTGSSLEVTGAEFVYRAVVGHRELVTGETLATELSVTPDLDALDPDADGVTEVVVGERYPARLRVTKR